MTAAGDHILVLVNKRIIMPYEGTMVFNLHKTLNRMNFPYHNWWDDYLLYAQKNKHEGVPLDTFVMEKMKGLDDE